MPTNRVYTNVVGIPTIYERSVIINIKQETMGLMARLNRKLFSDKEEFAGKSMGRGQMKLLTHIIENEGLSQDEIAKNLCIDKTTVAKSVKKLEHHNFVTRQSGTVDKRKKIIFATDDAKEMQEQMMKRREKYTEIVFAGTTEEEINAFTNVLLKIETNLDEYHAKVRASRELGRCIVKTILKSEDLTLDDLEKKLEKGSLKEKVDSLISREILYVKDNYLKVDEEWLERRRNHHKKHHHK